MGRIPQHFIDELLARTDIVELVDARVPLKKQGREFAACCPFHAEKTPSFYVSPQKQFYHCFGCGAHGTAISFLMEFEHLEFPEAVRQLAEQAGLEVPEEASGRKESGSTGLYAVLEQAAAFYRRQLKDEARAVEYLKKRGLTGEIAAEFGIGYTPAGWDALLKAVGRDAATQQDMAGAGLLIKKDSGGYYDRFRDRIMFPIRDARGRVIAFGGRVIGAEEPKYLNSPETPLFHKGRELYGLYEARQALRDIPRLIVVEGYMDVVALAQHGIRYAVATLGTATTPEHLNRLFRVTNEVVFCFDGDRAGRQAAWRALENALPAVHDGRQIKFLFLPEGEDPDSLVRSEGSAAFEARLPGAQALSDFLLESLKRQTELATIDGRARLVDLAKPLIAKVPDPVYRTMVQEKLAQLAQMGPERLSMLIGTPARAASGKAPRPSRRLARTPVRLAVILLLNQPRLAGTAGDIRDLAGLDLPGMDVFMELAAFFQAHPAASAAQAIEHWRDTETGRHLARLAQEPLETPEDGMAAEFQGLLNNFRRQVRERRLDALSAKDIKVMSAAEKAELQALHAALGRGTTRKTP